MLWVSMNNTDSPANTIANMVSFDWRLTAATMAGGSLVVGVAVALGLVGLGGPWTLVPTAVGVGLGYALYRRFSDDDPLAGVLN